MTKKEEQELLARVATLEETVKKMGKIFKPDQLVTGVIPQNDKSESKKDKS